MFVRPVPLRPKAPERARGAPGRMSPGLFHGLSGGEAGDAPAAAAAMLRVISSGIERIELRRRRQSERR